MARGCIQLWHHRPRGGAVAMLWQSSNHSACSSVLVQAANQSQCTVDSDIWTLGIIGLGSRHPAYRGRHPAGHDVADVPICALRRDAVISI